MERELFDFAWKVDGAGYRLDSRPAPALPSDSAIDIVRLGGGQMNTYRPPADLPLHRIFKDEVNTPETALAFVKRYGFLGSVLSGADAKSERVENILYYSASLKRVIDLIDHPVRDGIAPLGEAFNAKITAHLTVKIDYSDQRRRMLQIVPLTLISYMWLLVSQEITEGDEWRRCEQCGRPFFVRHQDGREQKRRFCAHSACRVAAHRKAHREEKRKKIKQSTRKGKRS